MLQLHCLRCERTTQIPELERSSIDLDKLGVEVLQRIVSQLLVVDMIPEVGHWRIESKSSPTCSAQVSWSFWLDHMSSHDGTL